MHFSRFARTVNIIVRGPSLKDTLSQYLLDRIYSTGNVRVMTESEVIELEGEENLRAITVVNRASGDPHRFLTRWLFVCIGGDPHTASADEVGIVRDEAGYLVTGSDVLNDCRHPGKWPLNRTPFYLETNIPSVFAAGDVRHNSVKRLASAVGEGAMAVTFVHRYLAGG
jgi:thioredoxin reductase (NADPH)